MAAALAACGGSSVTNPGQSSSCSVTLRGGVTGTFDCKPATTVWQSTNNQSGFTFSVPQTGTGPQITVAIGMTGEPQSGTYSNSTAGVSGGATVQTGSGSTTQYWIAAAGSGSSQGTFSLVFSSVSNAVSGGSGKVYQGEGTLTATLKSAGSGADVTMSATF
jgi:hypothetical protein